MPHPPNSGISSHLCFILSQLYGLYSIFSLTYSSLRFPSQIIQDVYKSSLSCTVLLFINNLNKFESCFSLSVYWMPDIVLNAPHVWTYLTIIVCHRKVLFHCSLIKKLSVREVKQLAQVHTVKSDRAGP